MIERYVEQIKRYNRLKYEVKNEIKKAKNEPWEGKCDELDNLIGGTKSRQRAKNTKHKHTQQF